MNKQFTWLLLIGGAALAVWLFIRSKAKALPEGPPILMWNGRLLRYVRPSKLEAAQAQGWVRALLGVHYDAGDEVGVSVLEVI